MADEKKTRGRPPKRPPIGQKADERKRKVTRPPIWDKANRHKVPNDGKHKYLWVTDSGRQEPAAYQQSGWEFVTRDMLPPGTPIGEGASYEGTAVEESRIVLNVGRSGTLENSLAYLMRCPLDLYEEYREAELAERNRPMKDIMDRNRQLLREEGYYGDIKSNRQF